MAISRFSTSRVGAGLPKYQKFWDGSTVYTPPSFYSIQTATVDSGGASSITFSSIPSTYTHLQIRSINAIDGGGQRVNIRFNSDTGNNYAYHRLSGNGSSAGTDASTSRSTGEVGFSNNASGSSYAVTIIEILDYGSTSKYKTVRSLSGTESNGSYGSVIWYDSSLWQSTSAISSITLFYDSQNFRQYTQFALYGVK